MDIKTLASGSAGNAYFVSDGTTTLLLECGIPYKALMQRSGYRLSLLDACLVTHEHADHARAAHDLLAVGIPLYCSAGTADALHITTTPGARPVLRHLCAVSIGTMTVLPVSVCHDAAEPLGWSIVSTADCTRLVFLTDTSRADYIFPPANHIMIECNHMGATSMADTNAYLAYRVLENHLSLQACIDFLQHQDLSRIRDIRLIHISRTHGDPDAMCRATRAATGKQIIIASEEKTHVLY